MNVAIIPARGGSTRIPRKNVRPFHGKPIIQYSIECAKKSRLFDAIYVSTDDPMIGIIAHHAGATPVLRPAHLARDEVGTQEVTRSVLQPLTWARYACCIYATAPLMRVEDLAAAFQIMTSQRHDFVYSVGPDDVDAGQFYWGSRAAFMNRLELTGPASLRMKIPAEHVCDINTEEDWQQALEMYLKLLR